MPCVYTGVIPTIQVFFIIRCFEHLIILNSSSSQDTKSLQTIRVSMNKIEGDLIATDVKIAFVVSRFNEFVCERLLEGALDSLARHGGNKGEVTVLRVPGAFELPLAAKKLAASGKFDAIVCLGAVIRGETSHYDYICANASSGIASTSLETGVPVSFGLLTTETLEQAIERSGSKAGNQGRYATECAIEMARLIKQI